VSLFQQELTSEALLTLLKHPLTHSGLARNTHLRFTRDLELYLRRSGTMFPTAQKLSAFGETQDGAQRWYKWVVENFCERAASGTLTLETWVSHHIALAEGIARGSEADEGSGGLWDEKAGREAVRIVGQLQDNAAHAGEMAANDYSDLFGAVLSRGEVRDRDAPHPHILIWGTLEARVQGADLLILGGLNEGSWPESPAPDPWLNRKMRHEAGLLLPERRIGLSAHDFQQAVAAKEVWLTRSIRSDEAETVPSRWVNRLANLLTGLPDTGGPDALDGMRARGEAWLARVAQLETVKETTPAKRPAPRPPVSARPVQLSVTEIKRLIRDPYAIYAKHVLRLRALDPLMKLPDALLRGIVVHEVLEQFVKDVEQDASLLTHGHLMQITETILAENVPWDATRALWMSRMERVSDHLINGERTRRSRARPVGFEARARLEIPKLGFTLRGTADRIDRDENGNLLIYDYKTGTPPTADEQKFFDKQLLLEAAMAERGGFHDITPSEVVSAIYLGLGNSPKDVAAPLVESPPAQVWAEFEQLITKYQDPDQGFTARRALRKDTDVGDYDQLARFGEWEVTDAPEPEDLA
jgi:double-strand break repair protein AddB